MTMRVFTGDIARLAQIITPMLLVGDNNFLRALREQYDHLVDVEVDFNGYGFYVNYTVDDRLRIMNENLQYSVFTDMVGNDITGDSVVGFQIFITDGVISTLEGFPFAAHEWPVTEIVPVYTYQPDECHVRESEARFPQVIEKIKNSDMVVTKGFLESEGVNTPERLPPMMDR